MLEIAIITPLKRLENIPILLSNLRYNALRYGGVIIHWYPIFDQSEKENFPFWSERLIFLGNEDKCFLIHPILSPVKNAVAGHAHRNIVLKELQKQFEDIWVYNLDDDNVLHKDLITYLLSNQYQLSQYAGLLISQIFKGDFLRLTANKDKVVVCHVDTAMLIFRLKYLNSLSYIENDYCADGHFINAFYELNNKNILIEKRPLCYYNYLKT